MEFINLVFLDLMGERLLLSTRYISKKVVKKHIPLRVLCKREVACTRLGHVLL